MANVTGVTKHFAVAKEGFTTTTSATIAPAATTVPLNSVTGYSNGDVVVLVIDGDDIAKKQVFTGTVDTTGVQITNVVWTEGSNTTHTAGASVVDYVAATHQGMTTKGILEEHKQDGTHGDVNADSVSTTNLTVSTGVTLPAGSLETADYADSSISSTKLASGAVERAKLAPSVVRRKSSGASTDVTAPRIQCGWEVKAYASAGTITTPITFPDTFATIPIVTASFAGDAATNTGYGSGSINLANGVVVRVNSITTSGFTLSMTKADGTNFPSFGFSWLTWMAIGD